MGAHDTVGNFLSSEPPPTPVSLFAALVIIASSYLASGVSGEAKGGDIRGRALGNQESSYDILVLQPPASSSLR